MAAEQAVNNKLFNNEISCSSKFKKMRTQLPKYEYQYEFRIYLFKYFDMYI